MGRVVLRIRAITNSVAHDVDFSDFSFVTTEQSLFNIKEKEKQWVEKQYFIYSNEYCRPFALFYLAFRYNVAGRYKE